MGLQEVSIILDNQYNTYYPGQTVYGTAQISVDSPKKIRGICVKFKGEAHTEWSESKEEQTSDGKTESTNTMHTGHEEYFQISYYIVGSNTGNKEIELTPGQHVYNFTCALPPVLPSSFEGPFGYVRYTVKVILDRPWKFDQETKTAFTVVNAFDLNLNPSYKEPIHIQMEKIFCCFCCASAPLTIDVRSPVSGYVPGQVIPIRVDVENKSNVQVHLVKIYIRKVVTYRATSPTNTTKKTKDVVISIQEGPAPAGSCKTWDLSLQLPPTPPSDLVNCNIIDLDYDFKVECTVSGMHMGLNGKKYIAIGTVPLLGLVGQPVPPGPGTRSNPYYSPGQAVFLPTDPAEKSDNNNPPTPPEIQPIGWSTPTAGPIDPPYQELYPTLTDPVYQKCDYASRNLHERGESQYVKVHGPEHFAPCYPTYAAVKPPPLPQ